MKRAVFGGGFFLTNRVFPQSIYSICIEIIYRIKYLMKKVEQPVISLLIFGIIFGYIIITPPITLPSIIPHNHPPQRLQTYVSIWLLKHVYSTNNNSICLVTCLSTPRVNHLPTTPDSSAIYITPNRSALVWQTHVTMGRGTFSMASKVPFVTHSRFNHLQGATHRRCSTFFSHSIAWQFEWAYLYVTRVYLNYI